MLGFSFIIVIYSYVELWSFVYMIIPPSLYYLKIKALCILCFKALMKNVRKWTEFTLIYCHCFSKFSQIIFLIIWNRISLKIYINIYSVQCFKDNFFWWRFVLYLPVSRSFFKSSQFLIDSKGVSVITNLQDLFIHSDVIFLGLLTWTHLQYLGLFLLCLGFCFLLNVYCELCFEDHFPQWRRKMEKIQTWILLLSLLHL